MSSALCTAPRLSYSRANVTLDEDEKQTRNSQRRRAAFDAGPLRSAEGGESAWQKLGLQRARRVRADVRRKNERGENYRRPWSDRAEGELGAQPCLCVRGRESRCVSLALRGAQEKEERDETRAAPACALG